MRKLAQELDKLQILVAVAEKGKINEAAEVLRLTQPSVSRAVQILEEAFGSQIFVRSREGVKLTDAGTLLYEQARRMLRELDDIQVRARSPRHELSGKLNVGTYESLAEYLWPDFLFKMQKQYPLLQLSIKTSLDKNPLADLHAGKVDLLVDAEPQTQHSLVSWPLYSDKFAFYTAVSRKRTEYDAEDVAEETITFVQGAYDEEHLSIEDHLERAGYQFSRAHYFDSFSSAKRLAIRDMGIAVLPIRLAKEDEEKKLIKRVFFKNFKSEGFGKHSIFATVMAEKEKDPRIKKVISLLKTHLQ